MGRLIVDDRDASSEIYEHIARQIQPASRQSLTGELCDLRRSEERRGSHSRCAM